LRLFLNKAEEILQDPHRYKNLRAPMNHLKRVHIDRHLVLVFSVDEETKTVTLEDYDHHDNIY
jgi:mRNA-degrading endonuclease RelE of RelBE toxin-antitoxin system